MFNQIIRKIHSFLVENGIAETFRFIKSLDIVEISGISKNGKERVLLYDVLDEYGNDKMLDYINKGLELMEAAPDKNDKLGELINLGKFIRNTIITGINAKTFQSLRHKLLVS